MQAYSLDLRQCVAQTLAEPGVWQAQVTARFCVSVAFVGKLVRRQRQTGSVAALLGRGLSRCLEVAAQVWLVAQIGRQPDATLTELREELLAQTGQRVRVGSVWRVLDEQGLRCKKSLHVSKRDAEPTLALRRQYVEDLAARSDVQLFYFLDETGLRLDYTRRYGRAPGRRRVGGAVSLRRGKSLTLIEALGVRGLKAV